MILRPEYYNKFKCIGGKCKDSCCSANWGISVDKNSFYRYRNIKGEFGRELDANISRDRKNRGKISYGKMALTKDGKCKFLNEDNLCTIYINLGEEYLCNTCKVYPRITNKYGEWYEQAMTISCPEVARLIFESNELMSFELIEEDLKDFECSYINKSAQSNQLEEIFLDVRMLLIDIAQFREIPVWKRLVLIKQIADKVNSIVSNKTYTKEILEKFQAYAQDIKTHNLLEKIAIKRESKQELISQILKFRILSGSENQVFVKNVMEVEEFNSKLNENGQNIEVIEEEFNAYFEEREYILEHYIVYYLYSNFMKVLWTRDMNQEILILTINCMLIKYILLVKWFNNRREIVIEDIIDVIYSYSRAMEHNQEFKKMLYRRIKESKLSDLECIVAFSK